MPDNTDILTFSIAIIAILITLVAPIPIPEEQRLVVTAITTIIFLAIIPPYD